MKTTFLVGAFVALAAACGSAYPATTVTISPFDLFKGSSKVASFKTAAECSAAAQQIIGKTQCRNRVTYVTTEDAPPEPFHPHAGVPVADKSTWPTPQPGVSDVRLYQGTVPPLPAAGDWEHEGAFRLLCNWSHMSYDDPIVYPWQPGSAHHHTFFGNTAIDSNTTSENIRSKGNATCRGGTINLSGYWVPSMIDTATGQPIAPKTLLVYYKTGLWPYFNDGSMIQPLPHGLKIIAGDAMNTTPENMPGVWYCGDANGNGRPGTVGPSIPTNCQAGDDLRVSLDFPQCWDGKNLDSANHKSHMAMPVQFWTGDPQRQWRCPTTHPVVLPRISFVVQYHLPENLDTSKWRLASDVYEGPAGYSIHADWMNGWDTEISDLWGKLCMQQRRNCGSANLGDGREAGEFQGN